MPAGWVKDTNHVPDICIIDNTHVCSGSKSVKLGDASGLGFFHRDISWTMEALRIKIYPEALTIYGYIVTQSTTGNFTAASIAVYVNLNSDGSIRYHNGAAWVDTGYDFSEDDCNEFKIIHDLGADTFDMWMGVTQIVNGGDFYANQIALASVQIGLSTTQPTDEFWVDDYQIGKDTTLFAISPAQAGPMSGGVTI